MMITRITVFGDVMPYSLVDMYLMFNRNVLSASTGHRCEESTLAVIVNSFDTFLPKSKLHDMTLQKSEIICLYDKD